MPYERAAANRWLKAHKERYSGLKLTILGDDAATRLPIIVAIRSAQRYWKQAWISC